MTLDLLLVNVGGTKKKVYQDLSKDYSAIEPPFFAALTAGFIRDKGFNVGILDANAENLDVYESAQYIAKRDSRLANIVVYGQHPSASTALMPGVGALCIEIKKINPTQKIILTGLHPSALPQRTLKETKCDYVGEGEGFHTLVGLLNEDKHSEVPGLWYENDSNLISHNKRAQLIKNLDSELPNVAWDLLPLNEGKYKAHNWHCFHDLNSRLSYASISTSIGCPFACNFCCINAPFEKRSYRMWSPEWALRQIDVLAKKFGIKNLKVIDELFVFDPKHFLPIAEGLIERDYGLNIWAYARVDTIKEKYLPILKKAGFNWLGIGIESGNEMVRREVAKGKFAEENIRSIVKKVKNAGISIGANYIFGLPNDTAGSMQQTLNLATDLNCEYANFYSAMAYPGSNLYNEALAKGTKLPDSWIGYSQHSYETQPLPTNTLSAAEVLRFRDNAFNTYYTSPKYLDMLEQKFGFAAKTHVQEMTKIKLKRKLLGD